MIRLWEEGRWSGCGRREDGQAVGGGLGVTPATRWMAGVSVSDVTLGHMHIITRRGPALAHADPYILGDAEPGCRILDPDGPHFVLSSAFIFHVYCALHRG